MKMKGGLIIRNLFVKTKHKNWTKASPRYLLCSAHFVQSDFENYNAFQMGFASNLIRKDCAVPTIHATGNETRDNTIITVLFLLECVHVFISVNIGPYCPSHYSPRQT